MKSSYYLTEINRRTKNLLRSLELSKVQLDPDSKPVMEELPLDALIVDIIQTLSSINNYLQAKERSKAIKQHATSEIEAWHASQSNA